MLNSSQKNIALEALEWYGKAAQCIKAIEELAEVQQAIAKWLNYSELVTAEKHTELCNNIVEEIADCYIMLEQMKAIFEDFSTKDTSVFIKLKTDRLYERLEEEKEESNVDIEIN